MESEIPKNKTFITNTPDWGKDTNFFNYEKQITKKTSLIKEKTLKLFQKMQLIKELNEMLKKRIQFLEDEIQNETTERRKQNLKKWQKKNQKQLLENEKEFSEIREKIILDNLKLVDGLVYKYYINNINKGIDRKDLMQEGCLGLIKAAEEFDYEKGFQFSTFATLLIQQAIKKALTERSGIIRLPESMAQKIYEIKKTKIALEQQLQKPPSIEEVAEKIWGNKRIKKICNLENLKTTLEQELQINKKAEIAIMTVTKEMEKINKIKNIEEEIKKLQKPISMEEIEKIKKDILETIELVPNIISLETIIAKDNNPYKTLKLMDIISDNKKWPNLEEEIIDNLFKEYIRENINSFENDNFFSDKDFLRNKEILKKYFGLSDSCKIKTPEEIGEIFGLSETKVVEIIKEIKKEKPKTPKEIGKIFSLSEAKVVEIIKEIKKEPKTLEVIAKELNISRERVRQIIEKFKERFRESLEFQQMYEDYFGKNILNKTNIGSPTSNIDF